MRRYRSILARPGVALPFLLAFLGRLPVSMAPLGLVLLVQDARGSYALAGAVAAAFTVGVAVATPVWGALLDRVGQTQVLVPLSVTSAVLLAVVALGTVGDLPASALMVLAVCVGATFPPITPAMRAAWRLLVPDPVELQAAYALEAVIIEVVFVGGPLLLSAFLASAAPVVPLLVTAVLLGAGGAGYACTGAARRARPVRHDQADGRRGASPLRSVGVLAALAVATLVAVGFGQLDVSMAATANTVLGSQAKVGWLFTAVAGGSAVGGTVYGARSWHGTERARLPVVLVLFSTGLALVAALIHTGATSLLLLMPVLFLTGLSIAPGLIMMANLVDGHAARDRLSEAQSWLGTAYTAGGGAGTALAGVLVEHGGPPWSLAGASLGVLVAVVLAVGAQRAWRSPGHP